MNLSVFQSELRQLILTSPAGFKVVDPRVVPQGFRPERFRCNHSLRLRKMVAPNTGIVWVYAKDDAALKIGIDYAKEML